MAKSKTKAGSGGKSVALAPASVAGKVTPAVEAQKALAVWVMGLRTRITEIRGSVWGVLHAVRTEGHPLHGLLDLGNLRELAQAIEHADSEACSLELTDAVPLGDPVAVARSFVASRA